MKRIFGAIAASLLVVLVTAGCMKIDMGVTVASDDTVSGKVTMAFSKKMVEIGKANGAKAEMFDTAHLFATQNTVATSDYSDDKFVGTTYAFNSTPIAKFFSSSGSSSLNIKRKDSQLVVSGILDTSGGSSDVDAVKSNPETSALFDGSGIKVSITFPGTIVSTNGKQSGNTIVWEGEIGKPILFKAVVESPLKAVTGSSLDLTWVYVSAGVLVLAGAATFVVLRKKKKN